MKILIMGAGALGMSFGGFLAKAKNEGGKRLNDVTLVGRELYMEPIKKEGLLITGIWGRHLVKGLKAVTDTKNQQQRMILFSLQQKPLIQK